MQLKFSTRPLHFPEECEHYPPSLILETPKCQISFFLNNDEKIDRALACSLIVRGEPIPNANDLSDSELTNCLAKIDKSKPIIIICHGFFSWRNQMLISNLASKLSVAIDVHTLRFDFTGNGHSSGEWKYKNVEQDFCDLCTIVEFVRYYLKCEIECIIGHSMGFYSVLRYAAVNANLEQQGAEVVCAKFVNLAGPFLLPNEPKRHLGADDMKHLAIKGYCYLKHPFEDRRITKFKVTTEQVQAHNSRDSLQWVKDLGQKISQVRVLTIHGDKDMIVNVANAQKFDKEIPNHTLHIVEGADHNFNGVKFHGLMVNTISSFCNLVK